jgi:peptide-methionine (S)-S-oxide reductase
MTRASAIVRAFALAALLPLAAAAQTQTAVFSGGCFWGVDAVFKHVKGVTKVVSGYSGGEASTAHYETVSEGTTGQAESVEVTFDPSRVTYATLLKVFFSVAHDPTELNRQGPDEGTQYRSVVWYANADQQQEAHAAIARLTREKAYPRPIVTQVVPLKRFYAAEDYHQDYLAHHLTEPYIVYNDLPKIEHLKSRYPELYRP